MDQFITKNQSSTDPSTQKALALAEETLAKQSESDLTQAIADQSFEEKSAVAEYDATTEAMEKNADSVIKNIATGGTIFGGAIFIIGVGGGIYAAKSFPDRTLTEVLEEYAEKRKRKFDELVEKNKVYLDPSYTYSSNGQQFFISSFFRF